MQYWLGRSFEVPVKKHALCLLGLVFVLCTALQLYAQADLSSIAGLVSDSSGARIANCEVTITNMQTAAMRKAATNSNGNFSFPSLTVGTYEIMASASGFRSERTTVDLTLQGVTQSFKLQPGNVSEEVVVAADSGSVALQKETFELSQTVDTIQLETLPSPSDNLIDVAVLGPAMQPGTDSGNELGNANHFGVVAETLIVAGLGNAHNLFLQDGIDNVNLLTATANILASRAATQEVNVQLNGGSARFSQPSTFNVITKGGTNHVHGTVYDFLQNDYFNARNWFSVTTPSLRYNFFGANVGGPILKDKVFGFIDYSGQRSKSSSPVQSRVPTLAERGGDFSADGAIYDPLTFTPVTGSLPAVTQFNENMITSDRISAFGQKWLNLYPLPNYTAGGASLNYNANMPSTDDFDRVLGRIDWNISGRNQFFATFARKVENTGSTTISPGLFGIFRAAKGTNVSLAETVVLTPQIINVAKVGYNRLNFFRNQQGQGAQYYPTVFGLNGVSPLPEQANPPKVTITNYTSFGDFQTPEGTIQNRYQLADEVNWSLGKHNFYFGAEFVRTQFNGAWVNNNNGTYTMDGSATSLYTGTGTRSSSSQGNGLADLLLGYPNSAQVAIGKSVGAFRQFEIAGYVQDAWHVSQKFTFNLGLRYDFTNPPQDKNGRAGLFDISNTGVTPGTWKANYNDWGPRIGFAWVPFAKTSIRSGYGIYYSPIQYQNLYLALQYAPNFITTTYTFSIANPVNIQNVFTGVTLGSISNFTVAKTLKDSSAEEWNLSIEQSLGKKTLFTVAYIGDVTRHSSARGDFNQPYAKTAGNTSGKLDLRPQPNYGPTLGQSNAYDANYHGLAVRLQQVQSHGFSYLASYTYSRAMSEIDGDNNNIENIYKPSLDYAPASFDRKHNLQVSGTVFLPFGPGRRFANKKTWYNTQAIGEWSFSGIERLSTGQPISITANANADTDSTSIHPVFAQKICDPRTGFTKTRFNFFNNACFVQPATGTYGSARNAVRQPGKNVTDMAVFKTFRLTQDVHMHFRAEAFGVFNHPNFGTGGSNKGFTNQPLLTDEVAGQRMMQFELKFTF